MDPKEREAWSKTKTYARAALGLSGAVLPSPLDPAIVLSNAGTLDPMRSLARVETTIANTKRFISSAGVTASFDAELTEVSDDTPTLTEFTVTCRKAQAFVQATIEAWLDQPDITSEVAKMFADAKARLEGLKFIKGVAASNEPVGIETALAGTASEVNAAGEALVPNDVYGLIEALPVRWRNVAKWQTELSTRNFIHRLWNPTGTEPPMIEGSNLINTPFVLNSNVDPYSGVLATETATNRVLIVGDWKQYIILDRVGLEIEFVPHLFNTTTNLPDGRRGWYAFWRVGADSMIDGAFRMLDVQTTA